MTKILKVSHLTLTVVLFLCSGSYVYSSLVTPDIDESILKHPIAPKNENKAAYSIFVEKVHCNTKSVT